MKKRVVFVFTACLLLIFGCAKEKFDMHNPDVETFVNQLKRGKYFDAV